MNGLEIPFLKSLEAADHVLLAGAGGGFDVFSALPLYFALRAAGKRVSLANMSFSSLGRSVGTYHAPGLFEITGESDGSKIYFPEKHLAAFLQSRGESTSIYALDRMGYGPVHAAYQALLALLKFDTLVLVDGGTDSLMRGDEEELGTPEEDIVSIAATHLLPVARKHVVCLGFGVDTYHGVAHDFVLEAIAEITRAGGYLGAFALTPDMPAVTAYKEAVEYVLQRTAGYESIVCTSILAAIAGQFGNYHATARTRESELYINPLMNMYWCFQLEAVANRIMYLQEIKRTDSHFDLTRAITDFRIRMPSIRSKRQIPM